MNHVSLAPLSRLCGSIARMGVIFAALVLHLGSARAQPGTVRFAVIGDYGMADPAEAAVSALVKGWSPDNGSGFQAGNIAQFKWGVGSGASVWTTSSRTPSIASWQITIGMNPGTVIDTIYVRVCRSSTQTATAACSSGTHNGVVTR